MSGRKGSGSIAGLQRGKWKQEPTGKLWEKKITVAKLGVEERAK